MCVEGAAILTMYSPRRHHHHHHQSHHPNRRQIIDDDPPPRLYQIWKGRNKFVFGGRFIFGPDIRSLFLTLSLILIPVILFWAFVAKGIIVSYSRGFGILIVVFSVIFTAYSIVLLLMTSGRDPGIIPRNSQPPEPDDCDTSSLSTDWAGSQSSAPGIPLTKNVTINGIIVKVKYCQTCMLYRPPRCSHCSICNNCVERFDHHCPWVGQCIGKRNYRCFFMFVSSTTLLCLYILIACLMNLKTIMEKDECNFWKAIQRSPVSGILVLYTFVVCWFVGGLTAFHLYLIARNQTTYENFRYQYDRRMNPYNLGCTDNFKEVFCTEIPHSRHNFRGTASIESGVVAYSVAGSYIGRPTIPPLEVERRQTADVDEFQDGRNHAVVGGFGGVERPPAQQNEAGWDDREDWDTPPGHGNHRPRPS